jgi:glycerol-3-phosphate acyltransferase PlsY
MVEAWPLKLETMQRNVALETASREAARNLLCRRRMGRNAGANLQIGAFILTVIGSYLVGSFPTGYVVGRIRGVDVRKQGSGNIGATNAFRVLGKGAGAAVLLIDGFKGFAATRWMPLLAVQFFPSSNPEYLALVAGVAAVLGHNYTCWLRFKGGKGIATSAGVVMAWAPLACLCALVVWGLMAAATRYVSVASIAAAIFLPIGVWFTKQSIPMTCVMAALSVLAIYKHRGNVQRLRNGTENRLGANRAKAQNQFQP